MATARCPVCGVSLKEENLARHLKDQHPRSQVAAAERTRIQRRGGPRREKRAASKFRFRWYYAALALLVAAIVVGAYYASLPRPPPHISWNACITSEDYHIHPQLSIIVQGSRYQIPHDIGVSPSCVHPLHTHTDYDPATQPAVIHVESPVVQDFTLGEFFLVWGQTLRSNQVLNYPNDGTNTVRMTVDGTASTAFGSLVLRDAQQIVITYGP